MWREEDLVDYETATSLIEEYNLIISGTAPPVGLRKSLREMPPQRKCTIPAKTTKQTRQAQEQPVIRKEKPTIKPELKSRKQKPNRWIVPGDHS